jgi:hypothetical protein
MQIKNRLTGRKPIRGHHGPQMFDVGMVERIEFQIVLLDGSYLVPEFCAQITLSEVGDRPNAVIVALKFR